MNSETVGSLLCAVTTGSFGDVYECGHYAASKFRLFGFYPVVAVWADPRLTEHSPRLLDLESAIELYRLSDVDGIDGVKRVKGDSADWRVMPTDA